MSYTRIAKINATILFILFVLATSAKSGEPRFFRIGTGGQTGVYYPIGKIIAQGITSNSLTEIPAQLGENDVSAYIGVAQNSGGSVDNVFSLIAEETEAGLVQADVAALAFQAEQVFKGNDQARSVRAVASLYSEKFHIVTRRDANIHTVEDFRGKRISIDEIGSGTLSVMRIVLEAYGMSESDFQPVYLKPIFTRDKMVSGELQGFTMMAGTPMEAVSQLSDIEISLVPISADAAAWIKKRYPYLVPGHISADAYANIPEVSTIEVYALLVVSATMDEALVYQITAALWSERTLAMLKSGHPQGRFITPETALDSLSIPLHPGARKYYQENADRFRGFQE